MRGMGTVEKVLDSTNGTSKLYVYSAIEPKVKRYYYTYNTKGGLKYNYNNNFEENKVYIEIIPYVHSTTGEIVKYETRYTDSVNGAARIVDHNNIEEIENIKNNNISEEYANLDFDAIKEKFNNIGTIIESYPGFYRRYSVMVKYSELNEVFVNKFSKNTSEGQFYSGDYNYERPLDNNFYWVELNIISNDEGKIAYDLRLLEKGKNDNQVRGFTTEDKTYFDKFFNNSINFK